MWYFSPPCTPEVRDAMADPANHLGCITTPKQGNKVPDGVPVIADNGRFGNGWVSYSHWLRFLEDLTPIRDRVWFATAPDLFNPDAGPTMATDSLAESAPWLPIIRHLGFPAALVAQNGLTPDQVDWDTIDVLFLGGCLECVPCARVPSIAELDAMKAAKTKACPACGRQCTEWKTGAAAHDLCRVATARGRYVHMGRVSSFERTLAAHHRGCASVDGTYITFGPGQNLPHVLGWLREINHQPDLFDVA